MTDSQHDPHNHPGTPPAASPPADQPSADQPPATAASYPPPPVAGYQPPSSPAAAGYDQSTGQPVGPTAGQGQLNQNDERMWAMLSHLGGILLGFIAPLIVWMVYRERSAFVGDQAREALNFQITLLIGYVVSAVLTFVVIGMVTGLVIWVAGIILSIIAGLAAQKGQQYRYPFALRLIN